MVTAPKHTPREKNDCVTAAYQTDGSKILFQVGSNKKIIPLMAPFKVTPLINRQIIMM